MSDKLSIFICGQARHGKDTVAELLAPEYKFASSSLFCAEKIVYPALKDKYGYNSIEECFNDRVNHRVDWFNLIADYNKYNLARLAEEIFKENDIYVGIRNINELITYKQSHPYTVIIYVNANVRLGPTETKESNTVTMGHADYIVYNDRTQDDLVREVDKLKLKLARIKAGHIW